MKGNRPLVIFAAGKILIMEYKKNERRMPKCLECGDKIRYGRKDKKFCCEECKNRYFNAVAKDGRAYKRKILNMLSKNYDLLENLIKAGHEEIDLVDIIPMGFAPDLVTFCHRTRRHDECRCFDIKYRKSETRLYGISKIQNVSVPLQTAIENK